MAKPKGLKLNDTKLLIVTVRYLLHQWDQDARTADECMNILRGVCDVIGLESSE